MRAPERKCGQPIAGTRAGLSSAEILSVLKAAGARSALLESGPQAAPTIAELVKRVDLRKNGIETSINLESLLSLDSVVSRAPTMTFTRFAPLQMKRRGVAMLFNAHHNPLGFILPPGHWGRRWTQVLYTHDPISGLGGKIYRAGQAVRVVQRMAPCY